MANKKITDLAAATTPLAGTEELECVQGGASVRVAASDVAASFTTDAGNILPVANGGTGAATLTGYVKGSGTSAMTASATVPFNDIANRAYASFYSSADQTGSTATPTAVIFGSTGVAGSGITVVTDGSNLTRITLAAAGTYKFDLSLQAANSDAADHDIRVWARLNGSDIASTTTLSNVPKAADGGTRLFDTSYFVTVTAGQYVQIMYLISNAAVTLDSAAAVVGPPAYPLQPSAQINVIRVA